MQDSTNNPYDSPIQTAPGQDFSNRARTLTLKRLGVLSVGKLVGVVYAILGLVLGGFFSLIAVAGVAANGGDQAIGGIIGGVGAIIMLPILYGVLGFVGGIVGAFLFNVCANVIGGIEMDFEG
ncbi:hypothetical protein SAMN06265222_11894 [Neorhodopirellula lusitana]|uniref:DUF3566 domain-containing protein n=1 Tax=Neorhodopirellula lusitana TaxID=445327 RepID=A0ABY1QMG2_9BACT|nr:hypothetical protein [Neorhodopirellula lusitana]SMP74962.1 hypothetical protein SAMN06265222_11894 [Neorhodopirellula lusitana]